MTIYTYEVELKLTNRNTREVKLVTRTEHAYSVSDALMQASMNQAAIDGMGSSDIDLVRIGPPAEAIRKATEALADALAKAVASIGKRPPDRRIDAVGIQGGKATSNIR